MKNYTNPLKSFLKPALFLIILPSLVFFTGCKKDEEVQVKYTKIKLVNAISGSTGLDLYIDDNRKQENIGFGTSSPYYEVNEGKHKIDGTAPGSKTNTVSVNQSFTGNTNYSIYAINNNETLVVTDTISTGAPNAALIRYLNISPADKNASYLIKEAGSSANFDFAALPNKQHSNYKSFAPGLYTFSAFDVSGFTNATVYSDELNFESGKIYTIFLMGTATGNNLALKVIQE